MNRRIILFFAVLGLGGVLRVSAQGTAFNYQGRLGDAGSPASGSYDFRFGVFNAVTNGSQFGPWLTNTAVPVSNGLFSVTLDFGTGVFTGTNLWLDLAVRTNGGTNFTLLSPRQPVLPAPYAIFAATASNVSGSISSAQLTGTIPSAQISGTYSSSVNFSNAANNFAGAFTGNGAGLNSLNASQLSSGTVADGRLSANVALLDHSQTFSGANSFTNMGNSFTGSFFGNGLVGWIPVSGNSVQANIDTGYLLTSAQPTTVSLPTSPNLGDIVRISGAGSGGWRVGQGTNQSIVGSFSSYKNSIWSVASVGSSGTWRCLASSADGQRMYAGMQSSSGIFASTDAGQTWNSTPATGTSWYGLACSADGTRVYGVPFGGNIQYSTNAGATWSAVASSARNWVGVACSADGSKVLAAVRAGQLYLSTNSGAVWNLTGPAANQNWNAVAVSADGACMAAAINGGNIYVSTNTGTTWSSTAPSALWGNVAVSADGARMVGTIFGNSIYTSTNSGGAWNLTGAPTNYWSCLAASADCNRLVAGVSNSVLYASANFGATWAPITGSTNQPWSALACSADGSVLAAAANKTGGNLFYSSSSTQVTSQTGTNGYISGSQGSAVELQYIGNGRFMPVSSAGVIWAN